MTPKAKAPLKCRQCGTSDKCACVFVQATINWKTREGVCRRCYGVKPASKASPTQSEADNGITMLRNLPPVRADD